MELLTDSLQILMENLYTQVDSEGRELLELKEISDHRRDNKQNMALHVHDGGYIISKNGDKFPKEPLS